MSRENAVVLDFKVSYTRLVALGNFHFSNKPRAVFNDTLLDMLVAFAEVSKVNKYVRPQIVESGKPLIIRDGRHPVVEVISKDKFIPK